MDSELTYLVILKTTSNDVPKYSMLLEKIGSLGAVPVPSLHFVWLLRASERAVGLYTQLAPFIVDANDALIIAEITGNTFGSYITRGDHDIAGMIGSARREFISVKQTGERADESLA